MIPPAVRSWFANGARHFSKLWLMALLALVAVPSQARQDFITARAVMEDPSGRLAIADAAHASYRPIPVVLAVGYSSSTFWVRLKIEPPPGLGDVVLRIRPTYLDELMLYAPDPTEAGGWRAIPAGDRVPQASRERPGTAQNLVLHGLSGPTDVYLRVRSTSNLQVHAEAFSERDADDADNRQTTYFGIYLGVMLALVAWAVVDLLVSRDRVLAWFIPYQISNLLFGAGVMGYLGWYLPPAWAAHSDQMTSAVVIATPFFGILCNLALLGTLQPARWGLRVLATLAWVPVLELVALAMGHTRPALVANTMLILVLGPLFFIVSLTTRVEGVPRRAVLRGVYAFLALHMLMAALPVLGWVEAVAWRLHSSLIHGWITGVMMFSLLHARSGDLLRSRQQALLELQAARERTERERLRKEEKSRFMTMLTHELHSPLLVMRLAMAQVDGDPARRMDPRGVATMHEALRDMEKLIDRCTQADRIEQPDLPVVRESVQLAPMLDDLVQATGQAERLQVSGAGGVRLRSDEGLLRVVVGNLLDNALKYAAPGSVIQLQAEETTEGGVPRVRLRVCNLPGKAGIPDADRVFQKYYRSQGARVQRGTGLGLWLVRAISQHLGGDAALLPDGERVVFQIDLPA